ncbi:MAG: mechanosensitive ion channel family protein, partial [Cyanobacteria bacterium Co-bin8]|nr:mechanosensitive ion channel family protein [Cyanobacteria bacterium Co-bin8]
NHFLLEDDQRRSLRIPTIVRSLKGCKTTAVYLLGLGWALNVLGVSLSSVLTLSAILALAISFASQSLVKDLVNGFLILLEDQYAIGDYVTLCQVSGLVENLNLRITQLRDVEGRLITVPNSQITLVENWTRIWSRVDFSVAVAYDTDLKKALSLIETVAQALFTDPVWGSKLLEPPQVLGIDQASHEGLVIRVWLITKPMKQFDVRREMTRRVWLALEEAQIEVGKPQQVMWHHTADVSAPLQPEPAWVNPIADPSQKTG